MKQFILFAFNFVLSISCLAFCLDLKNYTDTRQEETRQELAEMREVLQTQNEYIKRQDTKIKQYEAHCDNVARCIIEGEW